MAKSELRRLLAAELDAIARAMRHVEETATEFWEHPETPRLSIWGDFPAAGGILPHPPGSVSQEHVYSHLVIHVKQALEIATVASQRARSAGARLVEHLHAPGFYAGQMLSAFLSPAILREMEIPLLEAMSQARRGIHISVGYPDPSLLEDYLQLPFLCGAGFPVLATLCGWGDTPEACILAMTCALIAKRVTRSCSPTAQCAGRGARHGVRGYRVCSTAI